MSISTDWDVDRYRTDYESEEHWELRKAFIEAHKDKFPEDELVCLAQVFTNIEFLGCRYPYKTMERVAHLSKEIAAKFREARSGRLKRTFVGASDAASAKAKGRGSKANNQITSKKIAFPLLQSSFTKPASTDNEETENTTTTTSTSAKTDTSQEQKMSIKSDSDSDDGEMVRPSFASSSSVSKPNNENSQQKPQITVQTKLTNLKRVPNTGFIVYETLPQNGQQQQSINILQMSAAKQGATVKFDFEVSRRVPNTLECVVRINDTVYGSASVTASKKEAKTQAFDNALQYARRIHYTIKQKSVHTISVDVEQDGSSSGTKLGNTQGAQLDADNKGFKMMKMLGWSGGALGVSGNGIEQPISIEMKVDRSGLGLSGDSTKLNYEFFFDYLTKYKLNETATYDLAFSKDFTKDERKILHEIANRLQLRSRSHNAPDGTRYIVIAKKLELTDLANEILNEGLRSKCYELISPTHPLPEKTEIFKKSLPPHLAQRKANKIGFNYKQQNSKLHSNSNQNPNGRFKPKQRKFF